jgi:sugar phosphate isomerase/epimerase
MKKFDLMNLDPSRNRRGFLKTAAVFSMGSIFLNAHTFKPKKEIGLQLYTIRDDMNKNALASLKKVSEIGYTILEAAGYNKGKFYGMDPKELKGKLTEMSMQMISTHTGIQVMRESWEEKLEASANMGCKYVVIPNLAPDDRRTIDDYKRRAEEFNRAAETSKKYGLQFGYHNHAFEFETLEGQIPMEVLIQETDGNLVTFELDLYWVVKAGYQPVDLFNKFPGRFELWHVKDMDNTPEQFFAEVGSGSIDFKSIFAKKKQSGMKYFFVEQDAVRNKNPMEAINESYRYLSKQKFV